MIDEAILPGIDVIEEDAEKQRSEAKVVMCLADSDGNMHYIFGDDFVGFALTDALQKLVKLEARYAELSGKMQ